MDEWLELYELDPWGDQRADLRMGLLACATIAPHCEDGTEPTPAQFMVFTPQDSNPNDAAPKFTEDELKEQVRQAAEAWNRGNKSRKPKG